MTLEVVSGTKGEIKLTPSEVEAVEVKKQKAAEEEKKIQASFLASYQGKLCPILSMGMGAPKQQAGTLIAGITGLPPPQGQTGGEALACQGPNCMWFLPVADENGVVREGGCAFKHVPVAISILNSIVGQVGNGLLRRK